MKESALINDYKEIIINNEQSAGYFYRFNTNFVAFLNFLLGVKI